MDAQEKDLIRQIKSVGVSKAQSIFNLILAWEGEGQPEVEHERPKNYGNMVLLGQKIAECIPQAKRGRKVDPNSNFQRVQTAILSYLKRQPSASKQKCIDHAVDATGLSRAVCTVNANIAKGIKRQCGNWSLAA